MKKQIPAIVLAIACVGLLIAYNRSNETVDRLRAEIALLQSAEIPSGTDAAMEDGSATAVPEAAGTAAGTVPAEPDQDAATENGRSGRRMMENMAKMMENPTMNKVMEASQRGAVGALYTDLIEYLDLNAEETEYFMDLLMYRQMKQVDMAMKMMSGGLSEEEQQTLMDEVSAAGDVVKEEMERFLNSAEDYAEWEFYEETIGERMMLSQVDNDLAAIDEPLSDETYRELLGIMRDERKNYDFTSDLHDQQNMDMSAERFSSENVQRYASDIERLNELIGVKAQDLLTAEQLAVFLTSLKAAAEMQLAQLEMAAQMFGGGDTGEENP